MDCKLIDGHLPELVEECLIRAIEQIPFGRITLVMHSGQIAALYTEQRLNILPAADLPELPEKARR